MSNNSFLSWDAFQGAGTSFDEELDLLIKRCLSGDETAYVMLYDRHAAMIYRLAYGLLQNREDAEEVLQDSFEYAFRKLSSYDDSKSALTTWLYRITVSRCRNKRRRKWLPTLSMNLLSTHGIKDDEGREPDGFLEQSEQQRLVWTALSRLSPKLRETAVLRYYYGLRYKEIADILDISPKTVESRMRLAHQKLREIIDAGEEAD